jgi:DNA-binding transcriptional MocR family regulator
MEGFILLHRKIMESWIWQNSNALKLWSCLLFRANYKATKINSIEIQRGQFLTSSIQLSMETKLARSTVEDLLTRFENQQQIRQQKTTKYRVITIVNYNEYQNMDNWLDNNPTTIRQQSDTEKEYKELKNKETPIVPLQDFIPTENTKEKDKYLPYQEVWNKFAKFAQEKYSFKTPTIESLSATPCEKKRRRLNT